jgi:flagellar biosynthetic protein FlhB
VIITNPTHYSVALKHDRGMSAPICVAKRVDLMAFDQEIATANNIPIVENVPLARALHDGRSMTKSRSNTTMPLPK